MQNSSKLQIVSKIRHSSWENIDIISFLNCYNYDLWFHPFFFVIDFIFNIFAIKNTPKRSFHMFSSILICNMMHEERSFLNADLALVYEIIPHQIIKFFLIDPIIFNFVIVNIFFNLLIESTTWLSCKVYSVHWSNQRSFMNRLDNTSFQINFRNDKYRCIILFPYGFNNKKELFTNMN